MQKKKSIFLLELSLQTVSVRTDNYQEFFTCLLQKLYREQTKIPDHLIGDLLLVGCVISSDLAIQNSIRGKIVSRND